MEGEAERESGVINLDTITHADALTFLRSLPDQCVQTCVSSPPYFGLRDYGADGQIGLEPTPAEYVAVLVEVYREVRRVLRDDGTAWINLGDSYASGEVGRHDSVQGREIDGKRVTSKAEARQQTKLNSGLPPKNRLMIPARVAIALQDDGWILRDEIIWHKPAPMPESVTDRTTKAHEMIYMLAKSPRYYYDADAIREPLAVSPEDALKKQGRNSGNKLHFAETYGDKKPSGNMKPGALIPSNPNGRNKRSVWTVNTEPFSGAHFATFPTRLIEPMILAGSPVGGVVLDPFMGSGTTALVARYHGRHYIGCELNAKYVRMAERRLRKPFEIQPAIEEIDMSDLPLFAGVKP